MRKKDILETYLNRAAQAEFDLKKDEREAAGECRPSVCALFKPAQDGGYLTRVGMIDAYVNCSYRPVLEEKEQENNVALPVTQGRVPIGYVGNKPYFLGHAG